MTLASWRKPLILAAVLFLLGTFSLWTKNHYKPQQEEKEEQAKRVFKVKDAQIASIKLITPEKQISFKCVDIENKLCKAGDNSKWDISEPLKTRADDTNVNSLVSSITNLSYMENIDLTAETPDKRAALLKEYKLNKELTSQKFARRIEVTLKDGATQTLFFGDSHPVGETFFAKIQDSSVFLIPNFFKTNLDNNLTYWRDKKIFSLTSQQINEFEYAGTKTALTAEKKDGQWIIKTKGDKKTGQEILTGDTDNIESFLSALTFVNAKDYISENKKDKNSLSYIKKAKKVLSFKVIDKTPVEIIFFENSKTKRLFLTSSNLDPLFEIDLSNKDKLDKALKDFRLSKLLTSIDRFTAKKIEFSSESYAGKQLSLLNTDSKWYLMPEKTEVKPEKVQGILDKLTGNKIKEFLSGKNIPTGESKGIIVSVSDEKNKKKSFSFWKSGNNLYAKDLLSTRNEAFQVETSLIEALPWKNDYFVDKPKATK